MKRLIVFGVFFIALIAISSCKKEVIAPNSSVETIEKDNRIGSKQISVTPTGNSGENEGVFGDITDPNDDDYTRKPKKKN